MRLSLVLAFLLIASVSGSYLYINMQKAQMKQLRAELQTSINNQAVLESSIKQQNAQMQEQLENQRQDQIRIAELSESNDEARQEAMELRNTFARHDLNSLAIAKPGLIEKAVNRGTKKVGEKLTALTDPRQFDEVVSSD
jgi:preprotein translocase subunit SecD